jgi:hypothetical protein
MNFAKSDGVPGNTAAVNAANRAFNFSSARPALISLFSRSMISTGVLPGAQTPNQPVD